MSALQEVIGESKFSQMTVINTVEGMQATAQEMQTYIEECNVDFKKQIMDKVRYLKTQDRHMLNSYVSYNDKTSDLKTK